jgi:hypothetical protein
MDVITGLIFGGIVILLFLLGHYVGVLMLRRGQQEPELTPEQATILAQLVEQPK